MERIKKMTLTQSVEELKSQLLRRKTTRQAFEWNFDLESTNRMLLSSYMAEVEYRGRQFVYDKDVKKNLAKVAQTLCSDKPKMGIMLCGTCGNGKTTMLYAFQNLLNMLESNGYIERNVGIVIKDAKEISMLAKDIKAFSEFKRKDLIGIEDMGVEPREVLEFGNVLNPVIDLLEARYIHQKFTFITTNLTPAQITSYYGKRVGDRLKEMVEIIVFENNTYREL